MTDVTKQVTGRECSLGISNYRGAALREQVSSETCSTVIELGGSVVLAMEC